MLSRADVPLAMKQPDESNAEDWQSGKNIRRLHLRRELRLLTIQLKKSNLIHPLTSASDIKAKTWIIASKPLGHLFQGAPASPCMQHKRAYGYRRQNIATTSSLISTSPILLFFLNGGDYRIHIPTSAESRSCRTAFTSQESGIYS